MEKIEKCLTKKEKDYTGHTIIFLDVDGVLNTYFTKDTINDCIGIDDSKVLILKKLVDELGADIVLSSSWKEGWNKEDKEIQDEFGNALDERFEKYGLAIADKTYDHRSNRGEGILTWLRLHGPVSSYIILDDQAYDFYRTRVTKHWVRTSRGFLGGLSEKHIRYIRKHMKKFKATEKGVSEQ